MFRNSGNTSKKDLFLLFNRQRLCSMHSRSKKFILKQDGSKASGFAKSLLLINVLCILMHL